VSIKSTDSFSRSRDFCTRNSSGTDFTRSGGRPMPATVVERAVLRVPHGVDSVSQISVANEQPRQMRRGGARLGNPRLNN